MRTQLNQIIAMARSIGYVYLTTADGSGTPHMSIVQPVDIDEKNRLKLMAWLCQYTIKNLEENPKVSVIIWDSIKDTGYQLSGKVEEMEEFAELDGYAMSLERKKHFPQIEWKILVSVERILNFQKAPHVDVEV